MSHVISSACFQLKSTGVPEIDAILQEVANAGRGLWSTEGWEEAGYIEKIQSAADKAAESLKNK